MALYMRAPAENSWAFRISVESWLFDIHRDHSRHTWFYLFCRNNSDVPKPALYHHLTCPESILTEEDGAADTHSCSCAQDSFMNISNTDGSSFNQSTPEHNPNLSETRLQSDSSIRTVSRVKFDLDSEATSKPISCSIKNTQSVSFSLNSNPDSPCLSPSVRPFIKRHQRTNSNTSASIKSLPLLSSSCDIYVNFNSGLFRQPSLCSIETQNLFRKSMDTCPIDENDGKVIHLHCAISKDEKPDLFRPLEGGLCTFMQTDHVVGVSSWFIFPPTSFWQLNFLCI